MDFLPAPDRLDPPLGELHVWRLGASDPSTRHVLAHYLGQEPAAIELVRGPHGKPRLAETPERLRFNLSHSAEIALVAVSGDLEVGVDVERLRPKRGEAFYRRWARHEAHVKCLGVGLLRARRMTLAPAAVRDLDLGPGYAGAIAVAGAELPPLRGWTLGVPLQKAG